MMARPAGLEARERLEAFEDAHRDVARAEALLSAALAASATSPDSVALSAGVDLARRRLQKATARLETALSAIADGRAPYEALWSLPDDL